MTKNQHLTQIVYISSATNLLDKNELSKLLDHGIQKNAKRLITGLFLLKDGNILQVIEGPKTEVSALMKIIQVDSRHRGIIVLINKDIEVRQFPDWSMAFKSMEGEENKVFDGVFAKSGSGKTIAAGEAKMLVDSFQKNMSYGD